MLTLNFQSFALFVTLALINEIISSVKSANAFHDEDTTTIDSTTSSYVTDMFIERFGNKIKEEINNSMVGVEDVTKSNGKGKKHPCQRSCKKDRVMTCKYHFVIEYYTVMSKACFNCPFNKSHCESNYCIPGDGVTRTILTVNRQMPGPTIEVCLGDSIEVEVTNKLMDVSTAIHWHGLLQKNTPFMDGVPFVSQCPIGPRESFLYSFYADAPGTHLWHAHSALQRGDGIYGALIVKVPPHQNPHLRLYDFDLPQHVFTVMDWVHLFSPDKFMRHIHAAEDNQPPNLLINGKGQYREFENEGKIEFTPVETFNVKKVTATSTTVLVLALRKFYCFIFLIFIIIIVVAFFRVFVTDFGS